MHQKPVVIACAANAPYVMPLTVMLRSVAKNICDGRRLDAYVVDDGIRAADRKRVEESMPSNTSIRWIAPLRRNFDGLPLWGRMPITTYDKLTVADFLPAEVDRAIWLDCDMLVTRDVSDLWGKSFLGATTLAVQDSLVPFVSSRFGVAAYEDLGMDPHAPYFNAGMMLIDIASWRDHRVSAHALAYLKKYGRDVVFWDQEALNAVLYGRWHPLDADWNWSANLDRLGKRKGQRGDSTAGRIVHFNGNIKPWVVSDGRSLDEEYFAMVDETVWAGWRPAKTFRTRALAWYGSSIVRRQIYPAEQLGVQLLWRFTRRQT